MMVNRSVLPVGYAEAKPVNAVTVMAPVSSAASMPVANFFMSPSYLQSSGYSVHRVSRYSAAGSGCPR